MADHSVTDALATKRWQMNPDHIAVKPISDRVGKCQEASRAFPLLGNRRSSLRRARHCRRPVMLLAVTICLPAGANSRPAIGTASSGKVEISLSVAPRYKVLALKGPVAGSVRTSAQAGQLCLAANLSGPVMPVALLWSSGRGPETGVAASLQDARLGHEKAIGIWACTGESHWASPAPDPAARPNRRMLLVRPE